MRRLNQKTDKQRKSYRKDCDSMLTINIGCGSNTWGDIRVDYTRNPKAYYLNGKPSANFIADAEHLPFIDKCFSELKAFHVLEHVRDWKRALKEWCRVSDKIRIRFPTNSNGGVIFLKSILQNLDLHKIRLVSNNLRSMTRLKEQCNEHLWQIDPKRIMNEIKFYGFAHFMVKKLYLPIVRIKIPFVRSSLRTMKFSVPNSWDIIAW